MDYNNNYNRGMQGQPMYNQQGMPMQNPQNMMTGQMPNMQVQPRFMGQPGMQPQSPQNMMTGQIPNMQGQPRFMGQPGMPPQNQQNMMTGQMPRYGNQGGYLNQGMNNARGYNNGYNPYGGNRTNGMSTPPGVNRARGLATSSGQDVSERLARGIEKSLNGDMPRSGVRSRNPLPREDYRNEDEGRNSIFSRGGGRNGDSDDFQVEINFALPEGFGEAINKLAPYIFSVILALCLMFTLIAYGKNHKGGVEKISIPTDVLTFTGIIPEIYNEMLTKTASAATLAGDRTNMPLDGELPDELMGNGDDGSEVADTVTSGDGTLASSTMMSSTSGATMILDSGAGTEGYAHAGSYEELLTQLESAIAAGDSAFVGSKLAYQNINGDLCGYPQSVVDNFVTYMSVNADKRSTFISEITSDKYSTQNGSAYVIKLPEIKFVVNMGYDNTTISLSGFSDQVVNAGQTAEITPLLPCMYTLTITNPDWSESVTRDIEANVNETTLSINIKP